MIWLSELPYAQIWLQQFSEADREYAKLLINSLKFISQERVIRDLQTLIERIAEEAESPIALVPVREMEQLREEAALKEATKMRSISGMNHRYDFAIIRRWFARHR